jgi:hypothetical protein
MSKRSKQEYAGLSTKLQQEEGTRSGTDIWLVSFLMQQK